MLKKILKTTLYAVVIMVIAFVGFVYARYDRKFEAPYPDVHASKDSAVIARGQYLVYGLAHCPECHAPMKDYGRVENGEIIPLSGGMDFKLPIGTIHAPNITQDMETGIGKLTDGEIARTMRYGVKHDGTALLDFMPFYHLGDADLTAIVSYLRTVPPVKNARPKNEYNFLGKTMLALLVKPSGDGKFDNPPAADTTPEYGHYIAESVSNCRGCHTQRSMMTGAYTGPYYAGGIKFEMYEQDASIKKGVHLVPPNLTPDLETGRIAGWSREQFISRFRQGKLIPGSPMPWGPFRHFTDTELIAVYKYLHALEPVKNETPAGVQQGDAE